ncbi:hypothetical protein I3760_14G117500 [Carya illinoinensis]|nr:hypothetical protein I3760_14G117500 [Carya illinoinensis]
MAELVGGALLSSFLQVFFDRMASREFVDFLRGRKPSDELLYKLKNVLLSVGAVLEDAEDKQVTNSSVKTWLDELKDAVYHAEDVLDQLATKTLQSKLDAEFGTNIASKNLEVLRKMGTYTGISSECAIPMDSKNYVPIAKQPPVSAQVVIATPGKIKKWMSNRKLGVDNVRIIVIDEADHMLAENLEVLRKMGTYTGISSECAIPMDSKNYVPIAKQPPVSAQVVIATPGKIKKWMSNRKLGVDNVRILVIDEADHMLAENLEVLRKMGTYTGISSECAIPMDSKNYVPIAKQPPVSAQVVIATPGKIKKWMSNRKLGVDNVRILVIDEADHMLAENLEVLRKMGTYTGISSECAIPMDSKNYVPIAKQPPVSAQVVIATPGKIKKWMSNRKLGVDNVRILVIDEADHMLAENLEVLRKMGTYTGISSECAIPMDSKNYVPIAKQPPVSAQVVIATPGKIKKWMSNRKLGVDNVRILVIDEADHMLAEVKYMLLIVFRYVEIHI